MALGELVKPLVDLMTCRPTARRSPCWSKRRRDTRIGYFWPYLSDETDPSILSSSATAGIVQEDPNDSRLDTALISGIIPTRR